MPVTNNGYGMNTAMSDDELFCDGCGTKARTNPFSGPEHPGFVGGWVLPLEEMGYFGSFQDQTPDGTLGMAHICHDCCLKMIGLLPGLRLFVHKAAHPNLNEPTDYGGSPIEWNPCCDWAYCYTEDQMFVGEDGKWVPAG